MNAITYTSTPHTMNSFISNKLHVNNQLHIHISNNNYNLVVVAREDTASSRWQPEKQSIVFAHTFLLLELLNAFTYTGLSNIY